MGGTTVWLTPSRSRYGPLSASRPDVFPHFTHLAADRRENSRFSPDFPPWWDTCPKCFKLRIALSWSITLFPLPKR